MRTRTLSLSFLSAGLLLGGLVLPVAADDQPKEPTTTQSSSGVNPETRRGFPLLERVRKAVDELKLSDDQKAKIDPMFEDAQSQLKRLREGGGGDRQDMMKKTREVFQKLREDVAAVLTDEQKEQLKGKLEHLFQREAGATRAGAAGASGGELVGRLKAVIEKLDLSDEQKSKVHDLLEEAGKKARDLKAQAENGGTDAREKLRDLMQDTREKIAAILTDDQKQKLQESLQEGGPGAKPNSPKPNE